MVDMLNKGLVRLGDVAFSSSTSDVSMHGTHTVEQGSNNCDEVANIVLGVHLAI